MNQYRRLRMMASMSAAEAAKLIGVTASNILSWEHGKTNPRVSRLAKIAAVYGCTVADLLDDGSRKENPS